MKRASGIIMPISSLPSAYGIGTFGRAAYDFADFLHEAKQKYWQVLPLALPVLVTVPIRVFLPLQAIPISLTWKC